MIISTFKAGRLGNRLFHFSNFIVNSLENDYKLIYPFFDEYKEYFDYIDQNKLKERKIFLSFSRFKPVDKALKFFVKYFFNYKFFIGRYNINLGLIRLISSYRNDQNNDELDLNNDKIKKNKGKLYLLNGWLFRDKKNPAKFHGDLKEIFKPKEEYLSEIETIMSNCLSKGDIVVGVHIRRGDYREYCGGKYFLDDVTYLNRMKAVEANFLAEGKKCVFLISSNEKIDLDNFSSVQVVMGNGGLITDLYSLSQTDYLIGPPSTFTMWASFYGQVPLLAIDKEKADIRLSDFKIVSDL